MGDLDRASQACLPCRQKKRRCDKALPSCTLCSRLSRECSYPEGAASPSSENVLFLRQRIHELEDQLAIASATNATSNNNNNNNNIIITDPTWTITPPSTTSSTSLTEQAAVHAHAPFISLFFLDGEAFGHVRPPLPKPSIPIPPEIALMLGGAAGVQNLLDAFFSTAHVWFPFISKARLCKQPLDPAGLPADFVLLFLSMQLLCQAPRGNESIGGMSLYSFVKQFLAAVQGSGLLTLNLMQAAILIALYEICHAIYPAAYLSTGHCARLGYSLGLHNKEAPQVLPKPATWGGNEEIKRAWYAVMILDRYVNIGNEKHPLASGDFDSNGTLPADDHVWNHGDVEATQPIFITSSAPVKAGGFARSCQAAHLLGRVFEHRDDDAMQGSFRFTSAMQIHSTLDALVRSINPESETMPDQLGTAFGLLASARFTLYDPYSCTASNHGRATMEEMQMQSISLDGLKATASDVLQYLQYLHELVKFDLTRASPLLCDCIYQASATFLWLEQENGDPQMTMALTVLTDILRDWSSRWELAGEYLKLLDISRQRMVETH